MIDIVVEYNMIFLTVVETFKYIYFQIVINIFHLHCLLYFILHWTYVKNAKKTNAFVWLNELHSILSGVKFCYFNFYHNPRINVLKDFDG